MVAIAAIGILGPWVDLIVGACAIEQSDSVVTSALASGTFVVGTAVVVFGKQVGLLVWVAFCRRKLGLEARKGTRGQRAPGSGN